MALEVIPVVYVRKNLTSPKKREDICTMQTSQQIVVQKCVDSQQIHLNRKCRKKESVDLTAVHLGNRAKERR